MSDCRATRLGLLVITTTILSLACGGGGGQVSLTAPIPPVQATQTNMMGGNWHLQLALTNIGLIELGGSLAVTGNNISAILHVEPNTIPISAPAQCLAGMDVPVSGTFAGSSLIRLTSASVNGEVIAIQANVDSTGTRIVSSNFTIIGGCAAGSGFATGGRLADVTGTFKGQMSSKKNPNGLSVTATPTQTAADAHGIFGLSGNFAISGSSCFSSSAISGAQVIGQSVSINARANDGSTLTFTLETTDLLVSSLAGSYAVSGGMCDGDEGSGSLAKQ